MSEGTRLDYLQTELERLVTENNSLRLRVNKLEEGLKKVEDDKESMFKFYRVQTHSLAMSVRKQTNIDDRLLCVEKILSVSIMLLGDRIGHEEALVFRDCSMRLQGLSLQHASLNEQGNAKVEDLARHAGLPEEWVSKLSERVNLGEEDERT